MIIRDLNFVGISLLPPKAQSILIVDAYTMLLAPLSFEPFQAIPRRNGKFKNILDPVDLVQLPLCNSPQVLRTRSAGNRSISTVKNVLCPPVPESAYHRLHYNDIRNSRQPVLEHAQQGRRKPALYSTYFP